MDERPGMPVVHSIFGFLPEPNDAAGWILVIAARDAGQGFKLVVWRRRGQRPFQRGRTFTPWAVGGTNRAREGLEDAIEEDQQTKGEDIGANGRDLVPACEGFWIIHIVTWHAGKTREVHREEQHVRADECYPEMQLANRFRNDAAAHLREPVVPSGEDGEHSTQRQHVVEVGHDVIGVVQVTIETSVRKHNARNATNREEEDEADRPVHRSREADRAAPHRCNPREDLHARWHGDHHRGEHEVTLRVERQACGIHVVSPHDKADSADRDHGVGHAEIAENGLLREGRNDVADNAEARQNHDVHFRVTEEPEEVLVEDRVATIRWIEERGAEVAIGQKHRDRAGENRERQKEQEGGNKKRPSKERHLVHRHARCAHVQDRGDEVDRTKDRGSARQM